RWAPDGQSDPGPRRAPRTRPHHQYAGGDPSGAGGRAGAPDLDRARGGERDRDGAGRRQVRAAADARPLEADHPRPGRGPPQGDHHAGEGQHLLRRAAYLSRRRGDSSRRAASDSIAVALRLKAPIFTTENLLALTSVETGEPGAEPGPTPLGPDELKTYLQNLDPEDFGKFTP